MNEFDITKRLYVTNFDEWNQLCSQNYFSNQTPNYKTVARGIILPARKSERGGYKHNGGVCDRDLNFIAGYSDMQPDPWRGNYVVWDSYPVDRSEIVHSDEDVIFGGVMIYHFGHFMTETLARMWYIIKHPELNLKVAFIPVKVTRLQIMRPWVLEFLRLLGLPEDRIILIQRPTQFRSITIPDQALFLRHSFTPEALSPYHAIVKRVNTETPSEPKKIFLSRSPDVTSLMHLCNQEYFENFYRERGFEIVCPEKLSIPEQISIVSNATEIVTFLGTLSHWALFCRPGTPFTMLTRVDGTRALATLMRQTLIDDMTQVDWRVVSAAQSFLYAEQGGGTCLLGPTDCWRRYVQDYLGEKLEEERIPSDVIDDYVRRWCNYFGDGHQHHWINSIRELYRHIETLEFHHKTGRPLLQIETHLSARGWLPAVLEGEVGGVVEKNLKLQALRVYFAQPWCSVLCSIYYPKEGWTEPHDARRQVGTTGKDKAIYGLSATLEHNDWSIQYRIHDFNGIWSRWAGDGDKLKSDKPLNAIDLKIVPRQ